MDGEGTESNKKQKSPKERMTLSGFFILKNNSFLSAITHAITVLVVIEFQLRGFCHLLSLEELPVFPGSEPLSTQHAFRFSPCP